MPDYIAELNTAYTAYKNDPNQKEILANLAHKIKGAAGSVGLKRIQHLAASAQEWQSSDWEANIETGSHN